MNKYCIGLRQTNRQYIHKPYLKTLGHKHAISLSTTSDRIPLLPKYIVQGPIYLNEKLQRIEYRKVKKIDYRYR